jgi:hypothetical protein
LSCYMVGGGTIRGVVRRAWVPMLVMTVIALLMLVREVPPAWKALVL